MCISMSCTPQILTQTNKHTHVHRTPQKLPHRDFPSSSNSSQDNDNSQRSKSSDKDGTNWLSEQVLETTSKEVGGGEDDDQDEEDEEFESIQTDPLVFSREEFDAGMSNHTCTCRLVIDIIGHSILKLYTHPRPPHPPTPALMTVVEGVTLWH